MEVVHRAVLLRFEGEYVRVVVVVVVVVVAVVVAMIAMANTAHPILDG